ncbi:hypothetical protein EVAR_86286_1 [Eumeta japonica]|uniref:Uncharacterized protein n=1 Tax=Eumeta variegata TaxID=151549 RepID=A0A4C1UC38_EUMVA|nr:hypothetical protein EVAR_86286_1 [Eumeta japonica]
MASGRHVAFRQLNFARRISKSITSHEAAALTGANDCPSGRQSGRVPRHQQKPRVGHAHTYGSLFGMVVGDPFAYTTNSSCTPFDPTLDVQTHIFKSRCLRQQIEARRSEDVITDQFLSCYSLGGLFPLKVSLRDFGSVVGPTRVQ